MNDISSSAFIDQFGKLNIQHRDLFAKAIAAHPNTPGEIIFKPHRNRISHNQRKYFFGVVVEIIHAHFYAAGDEEVKKINVYNFLKERFLFREQMCPITNRFIKVYISLGDNEAAMNREEFTEKKEEIQRWAMTTLSLEIPDPDPNWRMYKKSG